MQLPNHIHNQAGKERRVGFEIEYTGLGVKETADIIQALYGGHVHVLTEAVCEVKDTQWGAFRVELDSIPLQKLADNIKRLEQAESITENVVDDLSVQLGRALGTAGAKIAPFEIVAPPIPLSDLDALERLRAALCKAGAKGTKETFFYAFGLHINPEVVSLEIPSIVRHLQSFLLLAPWLQKLHKVDVARRVTSFIDPFPKAYMETVLQTSYVPGQEALIRDYHAHNPSRNRALDMLPLFAYLDEKLVRQLYGKKEKIRKRPTFHYRLPNCLLENPEWTLDTEWKRWLLVEALANDENRLARLILAWQDHSDRWFSFESEWIEKVEQIMGGKP